MEKKFFFAPPKNKLMTDLNNPWNHTLPAYKMAPHVWNVGGNDDVCAYLLDSGEGLILIDTGYDESFYLLLDRIWRAGYDPADIKIILLSHWHWDHVNGVRRLVELSGASVWMSKEDEVMHQLTKDDTDVLKTIPYSVDNFYGDEPVKLGRFEITAKLTPGHTPGATSFFFEDIDEETNKVYRCAMHGGLGVANMRSDNPRREIEHITDEMVFTFINDCMELAKIPIDICLPSHVNQSNVGPNIPEDKTDYSVFVADYVWRDVLIDRAKAIASFYLEKYPDLSLII